MGQFDFTSTLTPIKLHDHHKRHEDGGTDAITSLGSIAFGGALTIGSSGAGYDLLAYGGTASNSLTWDASENVLNILSTMKAADNVIEVLVTDAATLSSGRGRALHLGYTVSGTKSGSYGVRTANIETTISNDCPSVCGLNIYNAAVINKTVGALYGESIYMGDPGDDCENYYGLDIGINSTNLANTRHTGIRIRNHSDTARSAILLEEGFTDNIRITRTGDPDINLFKIVTGGSDATFYWDASEQHFRFTPGVMAEDIEVEELGSATYDDLQDLINTTLSAGRTSGGTIEASGGSGDIKVNLGTGFVKTTDSAIGVTPSFNWDDTVISAGASAGDILDETVNYIYLDYNAGSPVPKATDDRTAIELNRMFTLGRVFRSGTTLHIINSGLKLYNHTRDNHERLIQVRGFERAQGGVVSEKLIRYLTATAGVYFLGAGKITNDQQDTSGNGHTLTRWYHTGGDWVSNTSTEGASAAGQISNEHYDNGTNIADIGVARYGVFWIFIHFDGDLQVVYGRGSYKLAAAENATVPTLPDAVSQFSILAAKIIVGQGDPNFTSIVSAYETLFPVSSPPNHWDLGGLQGGTADEYYHLTSAEHTELNAWLDDVTLADGGGMTLGGTLAMGANNITLGAGQTVDGIDVSAHDVATQGVHGAGTDTIATDADIATHTDNTATAHGAVSAATASKFVVRDASARAKFAQAAAAGDAIVADANNRAPDSTLLEGSSKATVQDHTPKAHALDSHSSATLANLNTDISDATLVDTGDIILKAFIAAKGDIIAATGDNTPVIVTVGTNTHVLTADSGQAAGVKWAAAAAGGSTVVWKDASERALSDANRTTTQNWADLDLTAYTSANATFAILEAKTRLDSYTSGYTRLRIRKNDTTPDIPLDLWARNSAEALFTTQRLVIVGLDGDEVMEYTIEISGTLQVDSFIDVVGYIE